MSRWGTLDAQFWHPLTAVDDDDMPRGSESGPTVRQDGDDYSVYGRLRDVDDESTSPAVLAWFARHARMSTKATLLWEIDSGPRYRYEMNQPGGDIVKLKGILDQ